MKTTNYLLKKAAFVALCISGSVDAGREIGGSSGQSSTILKRNSLPGLSQNVFSLIAEFLSFQDRMNVSQVNKALHKKTVNLPSAGPERVKDEMQAEQLLLIDHEFPREERKFFALNYLDENQLLAVSKADSQHKLTKIAKNYPLVLVADPAYQPSYGYQPLLETFQYPIIAKDLSLLEDPVLLPNVVRVYLNCVFKNGILGCCINNVWRSLLELNWILPMIRERRFQISVAMPSGQNPNPMVIDLFAPTRPFFMDLFATGYVSEAVLPAEYFMQASNLRSLRSLGLIANDGFVFSLLPEKTPNLEHLKIFLSWYPLHPQNLQPLHLPKLRSLSFNVSYQDPESLAKLTESICIAFPKTIQSLQFEDRMIPQAAFNRLIDHFDNIHHLELAPDLLSAKISLKQWLFSLSKKHRKLSSLTLHFPVTAPNMINFPDCFAYEKVPLLPILAEDGAIGNENKMPEESLVFKDFEQLWLTIDPLYLKVHGPKFSDAVLNMLSLTGMKASEKIQESSFLKKIMICWTSDITESLESKFGPNCHFKCEDARPLMSAFCLFLLKRTTSHTHLFLKKELFESMQKSELLENEKKRIHSHPKANNKTPGNHYL